MLDELPRTKKVLSLARDKIEEYLPLLMPFSVLISFLVCAITGDVSYCLYTLGLPFSFLVSFFAIGFVYCKTKKLTSTEMETQEFSKQRIATKRK